jgi:hypothetical protein
VTKELQPSNHTKTQTIKNLCIGILDITYYTVTVLSLLKKSGAYMNIRNNKEEHIRSTWSSLLLTSFLTKGIHAEESLSYGVYKGFVTCHLRCFHAFPTLVISFYFPNMPTYPTTFPIIMYE